MKYLLFLILFPISGPIWAGNTPKIEAIDDDLIFLSDGRVIFRDLPKDSSNKKMVKIRFSPPVLVNSGYEPSILEDQVDAYKIYETMRTDYREEAQCSNMAHVWAYEEFKKSGLKSEKIFLFFTKSYIRRYRFEWWFHVAPLVYAKEKDQVLSVVMDRRYASLPLDIKTWTDQFVKSKKECKVIDRIATFWNNQSTEDCYLMNVSMYYWQPRDIRLRDENGREKSDFSRAEIRHAYKEAFNL